MKNNNSQRKQRQIRHWQFFLLFLGCISPSWADAYTIYLKNGNQVDTEFCRQHGDVVVYEKFGGTISLQMNRVARLDCEGPQPLKKKDDGHPSLEDVSQHEALSQGGNGDIDLVAALREALTPTTAIELANISTLAIESPLGAGSGFFITTDGYILTNKHVVKFTSGMREMQMTLISKARGQLREARSSFELERQRINSADTQIRHNKINLQQALATEGQGAQVQRLRRAILVQQESLAIRKKSYGRQLKKYRQAQQGLQKEEQAFRRKAKGMRGNRYYKIYLADGTPLTAQLVKVSSKYDLALLKVDGYQTPHLQAVSAHNIAMGEAVYAIGNPVGRRNSVSSGVLSARRDEFIQTNAEINPGNSGGPLVSKDGEVIGINTKKLVGAKVEGMGFALDINYAFGEFAGFIGGVGK